MYVKTNLLAFLTDGNVIILALGSETDWGSFCKFKALGLGFSMSFELVKEHILNAAVFNKLLLV